MFWSMFYLISCNDFCCLVFFDLMGNILFLLFYFGDSYYRVFVGYICFCWYSLIFFGYVFF